MLVCYDDTLNVNNKYQESIVLKKKKIKEGKRERKERERERERNYSFFMIHKSLLLLTPTPLGSAPCILGEHVLLI